ncbi:DUF4375 domain-containing protein [Pseudomonas sp. WAC2]|uniref:DMP19 family protein n=1 Tax=Pseudomonas sp. WAC2 TaxID=3055057 RepID=UPI0025B10DAB|nr:DUF4375 domain-containing protein [Pseudomonas sp. WAC2]MDN3238040.1 DUF4375 domain-containing protein [Pseudomonas sp. WAC2]
MRISERYFQNLLSAEGQVSAVSELAGLWSSRANEHLPLLGLSRPEFNVQLVLAYAGEVQNGGHVQFFLNPVGRYASLVVPALREVKLPDLGGLLEQVLGLFPDVILLGSEVVASQIGQLASQLEAADAEFYRISSAVDQACLEHLRAHAAEVLKEERMA